MTVDLNTVYRKVMDIEALTLDLIGYQSNPVTAERIITQFLSDLSGDLGLCLAGEFRSGNREDPGDGFTGMRMAFPGMLYDSVSWNLVGVNNDVLQVGVRASDGKLLAGGGALVVDATGLQFGLSEANLRGEIDVTATGVETLFWMGTDSDRRFVLDANGALKLKNNLTMGESVGAVLTGCRIWLPFTGSRFTGQVNELDRFYFTDPITSTGSIYASRMIDKGLNDAAGVAIGHGATNYIANPSFEVNITDGWTEGGDGSFVRTTGVNTLWQGVGGLRITAGTVSTYKYATPTFGLDNGETVYVQVMSRNDGSGAGAQIRIYDLTNTTYRASMSNTVNDNEWELLYAKWTNNTGSTVQIRTYLRNYFNDSTTRTWFDCVQATIGDTNEEFHKVYFDGSLPDCSWVGTAHNSNSTRAEPVLEYDVDLPSSWTISFWFVPWANATERGHYDYIFEWYENSNDRIAFYTHPTNDYFSGEIKHNGTSVYLSASATDLTNFEAHHVCFTYNGTDVKLYVDNSLVESETVTLSFGTNPDTIRIGSSMTAVQRMAESIISDLIVISWAVSENDIGFIYANINDYTHPSRPTSLNMHTLGAGFVMLSPRGFYIDDEGGTGVIGINSYDETVEWGGFTVDKGDIVFGHNKSGSSGIWWDKSEGKFGFFGAGSSTVQVEIDTDGSFVCGGGAIKLNAGGIRIFDVSTTVRYIQWEYDDSGTWRDVSRIYGDYAGGGANDAILWMSTRRDSGDPWTYPGIILQVVDTVNSYDARLWLYTDSTASGGVISISSVRRIQVEDIDYMYLEQDSRDLDILRFRSTGDISHGMTSITGDSTWGSFGKLNSSAGAMQILGFGESTVGICLTGHASAEQNTRSTAANAPVRCEAKLKSGSGAGDLAADQNIMVIRNNATTRFIFDSDGDSHQDVGTTWTNFDDHDDIALLTSLSHYVGRDPIKAEFHDWITYNQPGLERLGLVTFNDDGHHFVNMSRLSMLLVGAVRQLSAQIKEVQLVLDNPKIAAIIAEKGG